MHARTISVALVMIGCGDAGVAKVDSGMVTRDMGITPDSAADARIPTTTWRGLVQGIRLAGGSGSLSAGFYHVAAGEPGCTWTFEGGCNLAVCPPNTGLVAASAGDVTISFGSSTQVTLTPDTEGLYTAASVSIPPGTDVSVSAAGATVGTFQSGELVMPQPLLVSAPAHNSTISRTQPLALAWNATPGTTYVNLVQTPTGGPYPGRNFRTIRCEFPAQAGSAVIPVSLVGGLAPSGDPVTAAIAASSSETYEVSNYEVTVRMYAIDMTRQLTVL